MMFEFYRTKARSAVASAKRERNRDMAAMMRRNARAYAALAREALA